MHMDPSTPFVTPSLRLLLKPVFNQGLIVLANAHSSGIRVVTFEDPTIKLHWQHAESQINRAGSIYVGKGEKIQVALEGALKSFHGSNVNTSGTLTFERLPVYVTKMIASLDDWLVSHKGSLRAVRDFDGSIIVRLEGMLHTAGEAPKLVVIEKYGTTFYRALASVLSEAINPRHTSQTLLPQASAIRKNEVRLAQQKKINELASSAPQTIIVDKRVRLP